MNEYAQPPSIPFSALNPLTLAQSRCLSPATGAIPSWGSYFLTLRHAHGGSPAPSAILDLYGGVFDSMQSCIVPSVSACLSVWCFYCLLTGARKVQMNACRPVFDGDTLTFALIGVKGGTPTLLSVRMYGNARLWVVSNYAKFRGGFRDTYLRQNLLRTGWSVFGRTIERNKALTHLFRYFFVQVLLNCLGKSDDYVAETLGSVDTKNIAIYNNPGIFRI